MSRAAESPSPHPLWIRASVDDAAFAHEQDALARLWTFVGFVSDLPNDGDWVRTTVGRHAVFLQRFGAEIRAFENRCAHRFYPLRTADRGNGPIVCGFHHWRYNQDGQAIGIPMCQDLFGTIPRDLGARIQRLDIDTCGDLVFARFPSDDRETLREFLGEGFSIIAALCAPARKPHRFMQHIAAHWKFSHHISLDDYHIVAVHPATFGKDGYLKPDVVNYYRFGRHSAFLETTAPDALAGTRRAIHDGRYRPHHYAIINVFPNFLISQFCATNLFGASHWYVSVFRYLPIARDRTEVHAWLYRAPFPVEEGRLSRWLRPAVDRILPPIVAHFARKIMREDNAVCEGQQALAHQVRGEQILSAQEERIGWFEEAYAAALGCGATAHRRAPGDRPAAASQAAVWASN